MKRSATKEKKSHSQKTIRTPEKHKKNMSFTQGDIPHDIEEILNNATMKKPRRAYNFYIREMMEKNNTKTLPEASQQFGKKWNKMNANERSKYELMAENDKRRYEEEVELIRRFILKKPVKEGATAYRLFLEDYITRAVERDEDPREAKREAAEKWKNSTQDQRREWNEKKREHDAFYEDLRKSNGLIRPLNIFMKEQMARAREKGETMTFKDVSEKWNNLKESAKEKFQSAADEINETRKHSRDLYEIAYGVKPTRPIGAYKIFLAEAANEGKLDGKSVFKEGSKMWKKLSEEQKDKYRAIAQREKLAYMVKKMEYLKTVKKNSSVKPPSALNLYFTDLKGKFPEGEKNFFAYAMKKWENLDEALKKKYHKRAEEQKEEFKKRKLDENLRVFDMPRKPPLPYNIYLKEMLPNLRKENPKKGVNELFKMVGERWGGLADKHKEKYDRMYEKSLEIYKNQVKEFEEQGYYTPNERKTQKQKRSQSQSQSQRGTSETKVKKGKSHARE